MKKEVKAPSDGDTRLRTARVSFIKTLLRMPHSLRYYAYFALLAIGVGAAGIPADWSVLKKFYERWGWVYVAILVLGLLLEVFWVWLVACKRQNWARWITLALATASIPLLPNDAAERFRLNPLFASIYFASVGVNLISCFFLLFGDTPPWMHDRSNAQS